MSTDPQTRLDDTVLPEQPASDWAKSAQSALGSTTTDATGPSTMGTRDQHTTSTLSPSVPGATSHVVQPDETGLDMNAKPQSEVDQTLGGQSAVSTPGLQLPGAWTDKPSTGSQMVNDATAALGSVGSAAYDALPDGVKGMFSTQTTNTSPIQTTTNHTTSSPSETMQSHLATLAEKGTTVAAVTGETAAAGAAAAYETITNTLANTGLSSTGSGPTSTIDKSKPATKENELASLPSQEHTGQKVMGGPMGGVGALPGDVHETGVAILPDDKDALANKPTQSTEFTTGGVQPTLIDRVQAGAAVAAATATAAASNLASTANDVYAHPKDYVPAGAQPYLPESVLREEKSGMAAPHPTGTLPSQEAEGLKVGEKVGGVGALPGTLDEEGVAMLPEEKANPDPLSKSNNLVGKAENVVEEAKSKAHPSSDKPQPSNINTTAPTNVHTTKNDLHTGSSMSTTSTTSTTSSNSPTRKATMMDKIKGQSKILTGKLSHNEEKIEMGKALKSGTEYSPQK